MADFMNLPNKEQFDTQNALLASIASHVGTEGIKVTSWKDVQQIVRMSLADKLFKVGDQFVSGYGEADQIVWDVIGINHDIPSDKKYTNSLTLQAHDCIMNAQFDAPEWLYYAEEELAPGTYYFYEEVNKVNCEFATTTAIPVGGTIDVSAWAEAGEPTEIKTYDANETLLETIVVTNVDEPTSTEIICNHRSRVRYGSNNYMESNIRQWLNSDETSFSWKKKSVYSKPSTGSPYDGGGFLNQLDPELLNVLGEVDKQVARNNVTDGGGQDLFSDKVFLLSRAEVFGGDEGVTTGEKPYPWYSALADSPISGDLDGRIKYLNASARYWWLRSPSVGNSHYSRRVGTTGTVSYGGYASDASGLAPACVII